MVKVNKGYGCSNHDGKQKRIPANADEVIEEVCRVADAVNTAIEAACATKTATTRQAQICLAKHGLKHLKQAAEVFPFIVLQGIEGVEMQIAALQELEG